MEAKQANRLLTDEEIKEELKKYFTEEQMSMPEEIHDVVCGVIAVVRKSQLAKSSPIDQRIGAEKEDIEWIKALMRVGVVVAKPEDVLLLKDTFVDAEKRGAEKVAKKIFEEFEDEYPPITCWPCYKVMKSRPPEYWLEEG